MTTAPIPEVGGRRGHEVMHGVAARGMFERIAPTYDLLNRLLSAGIDRRWRGDAIAALATESDGPFLDLCAGTLDLAAMLERRHPNARVVAADFSPAMFEVGRRKALRVELVVADAHDLPFEDRSFAAVICGFGMRNLSDLRRAAREVRRVLRPGGVFVTLELFRPTTVTARLLHRLYAQVVLPALGGVVSGDFGAYLYLARSMAGFVTRKEFEGLLREVGFSSVAGRDLTGGIASVVRAELGA